MVLAVDVWNSPPLTVFKPLVNWHIDLMGDGLLTLLFGLFWFTIAGLLLGILTFGGHGSLVQYYKEREKGKDLRLKKPKSVENTC